jgi:acetolactate synthase-1/2/3 large subunit
MARVTGGELVVRTLKRAGVEVIFGLHGAHVDSIFQSCLDHGLPIIDTRHEASAGHAAEGYARAASRLGVALVTAGGGFTNVVTSIANAYLDRTPVLFLTGSGPLSDTETNTLQAGIDQVAIASPVCKWAHRVVRVELIPRLLMQAIRLAGSAPRGPVLIDVPWDVLRQTIEEEEAPIPERSEVHPAALPAGEAAAALNVLASARRPVMVVGSEAKRHGRSDALGRLVRNTGIPVFADFEGLSLLSDLPQFSGGLVQGLFGFNRGGVEPDAVLMLGTRFGLNTAHGSGVLLPREARIVQIDPDARELGRLQPVSLGIQADVGASITALAQAASSRSWPDFTTWRRTVQDRLQARYEAVAAGAVSGSTLHPFHASQILARFIDENAHVVADGALTYLWLSEVISRARPGEFLCHGYLGSMGVGFGTAIGSQVAASARRRRTILVTGDGALGYGLVEFDTLARMGLPVVVVVMNNRSWGATQHFQEMAVGADRVTHTLLADSPYHEAARALGAEGYDVTDAQGFEAALRAALDRPVPACINVHVALEPIPPEERLLMGQEPF